MAMDPDTSSRPKKRRHTGLWVLGAFVAAAIALIALWDWDWFLPLVEAQASSALGRKVTAQHLHVHFGRTTTASLDGVVVANADGFPADKPFATIDTLTVMADVMAYIRSREIVLPQIVVDQPVVDAEQKPDGKANWPTGSSSTPSSKPAEPGAGPKIGQLVINDGNAHVVLARLKADFTLGVVTKAALPGANTPDSQAGQIIVDAKGTYAAQPITGRLVGGALLSLRDASQPYPVNLHVENGPTKVVLTGTVQNPLNFAGADLKLELSGPDMAKLTPLTGVPIPETPAYSIAGKLDYADRKVRFTGFTGRLGESDLNGDISVDPTRQRPYIDANLFSRRVQLADLGGFIGETPGRKSAGNQSAEQKAELTRREASGKVLPDTPINLPKLTMADVRLRYRGAQIEGRSVPLDNIVADLDINDGQIKLHPLSFAVGAGQISLTSDLAPQGHEMKTATEIQFKQLDVARLLSATHAVNGAGSLSGSAKLDSTGSSMATLLGHGDGGLRLGMSGGNLSALLVDIAGLEFGNALLSALGVPSRATLQCFAAVFTLQHGMLTTNTLVVDTSEAQIKGAGDVNLADETIDYKLKTASQHLSVGTFPTPIDITGKLASPSIKPEIGPLALRAGAAVGLGILFPPAALLPTIQLGTDNDGGCGAVESTAARSTPAAAEAITRKPPVRRRH